MSYTLDVIVPLGTSYTGNAANLRAQLVDTTGINVGSAVSTGFSERGASGNYLWHYSAFPDGHRGAVDFYLAASPSAILASVAINPEEAENLNGKLGTPAGASISTDIASAQTSLNTVLNSRLTSTRAGYLDNLQNLTAAPPTAAAIASAVWSAVTRTLSADVALTTASLSAIVDAVFDELLSGHTTAGSAGKAISDILADTASTGTGSVEIDQNYGGANALSFQLQSGAGIDHGYVRAYDADAVATSGYSPSALRGLTRTDSDGHWTNPMYLDPGDYLLTFATSDERRVTVVELTVTAP